MNGPNWRGRSLRTGIGLLALAGALGTVMIASGLSGGGNPAPTPAPTFGVNATFVPGLPIDTPPAQANPVYDQPGPGEEAEWAAEADWARTACMFNGGQPDASPVAMFKTTAGEVRRRAVDSLALGSNWHNEDVLYFVAFTGDYPTRQPPLGAATDAGVSLPNGTLCVYIGNGKREAGADNAQVGSMTMPPPTTIEGFFGR